MATTASKPKARTRKSTASKAAKSTVKKNSAAKKNGAGKKDLSASFNKYKKFSGQQYTGMQVGRSHHWAYDKGDWKETKITPDLWEISYEVIKRRKGHAPEGSGVPVGTEYQWYIMAHQNVKKLDANDYSTKLMGLKFKLAHKRAEKGKWSATAPTQRKHLIAWMKEMIVQMEKEIIPLEFEYDEKTYKGDAIPVKLTCHGGVCDELDITLNDENIGIIKCTKGGWKMDNAKDQKLIEKIGEQVFLWYE
ncbi:MAG: hypothetical protein JWN78_3007 [Bacteroidota bacterium]|nr:hypothetical protein [Bacteroidota bacterium]